MTQKNTEILIHNLYIMITLLLVVIICGGIITGFIFYKLNQKIDNIEPNIINYQLNPLQGWDEECIENKTITHYRYEYNGIVVTQISYDDSTYESFERIDDEFVTSWNETVCTKKMLVHNTVVPIMATSHPTIA